MRSFALSLACDTEPSLGAVFGAVVEVSFRLFGELCGFVLVAIIALRGGEKEEVAAFLVGDLEFDWDLTLGHALGFAGNDELCKKKAMRLHMDTHLAIRSLGKRVVFTNGCFDILHAGHVDLLRKARALGDVLVVGINSDASVRALKGPTRPINTDFHRANVLRELRCVDCVFIFDDVRIASVLRNQWPHVWAKGGDYTIDTLDKTEVEAARACGVEIVIIPSVPGLSTSGIIAKV